MVPPPLPAPPAPDRLELSLKPVASDDMDNARTYYIQGEGLGSVDAASNQEMRRWPTIADVCGRFGLPEDAVRTRIITEGWDGQRLVFQADLNRARQRGIAERIAEQEMPARLAYLGIHNDVVRGLGKMLGRMVPSQGDPTCLPRDLKVVLETACKAAELMAHATGRARDAQSAFSLAVQVSQAQALGVPVTSLPASLQASVAQVAASSSGGNMSNSLWTLVMRAREEIGYTDPELTARYEEDNALPLGLTGVVDVNLG